VTGFYIKLKANQLSSGSEDLDNVGVPQSPQSSTGPNASDGDRHNNGKRAVIVTPSVDNEKVGLQASERDA
jgi:hypothetical protein